jgi:hypothetical protein
VLRECNGTDRNIIDPIGLIGNCGREFDDAVQLPICPHRVRPDKVDEMDRPAWEQDIRPFAETIAHPDMPTFPPVNGHLARTVAPALPPATAHPILDGVAIAHHHHHPLSERACTKAHHDQTALDRHAYLLAIDERPLILYDDVDAASQAAQDYRGFVVALPIVVDWRADVAEGGAPAVHTWTIHSPGGPAPDNGPPTAEFPAQEEVPA